MTTSAAKNIALSKTKMILFAALSVAFVALGIWMFLQGTTEAATQLKLIGMTSVVFFGIAGMFWLKKILDHTPGLSITEVGFHDNSSAISAGFVPWEEVIDINEVIIARQKFVSIKVADPEKYTSRGNRIAQLSKQANFKISGTPVNISANSLKIKHGELLKSMLAFYQDSRVQLDSPTLGSL